MKYINKISINIDHINKNKGHIALPSLIRDFPHQVIICNMSLIDSVHKNNK